MSRGRKAAGGWPLGLPLKPRVGCSDSRAVFFARQEAPDPVRSALRSLRPSLNTPVVVVEDLPAGPASAAIACLAGPAGSQVVLAIRSVRSGQAVFFGPDDELRDWQEPETAIDAALTFAESMGFLFEDDRVAEAPADARRLWGDLLDATARARTPLPEPVLRGASPRSGTASGPSARDPEEIWLEEVVPPVCAVSASVPLTKFRRASGAAASAPSEPVRAAGVRQELGRFRVGLHRRLR